MICGKFEREYGTEESNQTNPPSPQSAFIRKQSLGNVCFNQFCACQCPKRPSRSRLLWNEFHTASRVAFIPKTGLRLNYCFEYPVFAPVDSFPTHTTYLKCNGPPHSLVRPNTSQNTYHRLLLSPRSTFPSHSPIYPLTFSGASHKAQCPVLTSLLVKLGINPSMPFDIDGGKASSFVPWIKRTGTIMVLFVSLYRFKDFIWWKGKGKGRGNVLQLIFEVHLAIAIPVH